MNDAMFEIVQRIERLYPYNLDKQFPRIVDKIVELWDTPQIDAYLSELLVSNRADRQGFPQEVAKEIYYLSQIRERTRHLAKAAAPGAASTWANIELAQQRVIESSGYQCTAKDFLRSAEMGDRKVLGAFISGGAKLDTRDERGWTPLMISAFNGNEEIAQLLINSGADIHIKDKSGYGPMHWAAFNGFSNVVKLLITKGSDINAQSQHGWTPLLQASTRGHTQTCAALIAGGADVNLASNDGWTPLHKACANGHLEVAKLLLSAKADRDAQYQEGVTPLALASKNNHQAIVELLQS